MRQEDRALSLLAEDERFCRALKFTALHRSDLLSQCCAYSSISERIVYLDDLLELDRDNATTSRKMHRLGPKSVIKYTRRRRRCRLMSHEVGLNNLTCTGRHQLVSAFIEQECLVDSALCYSQLLSPCTTTARQSSSSSRMLQ